MSSWFQRLPVLRLAFSALNSHLIRRLTNLRLRVWRVYMALPMYCPSWPILTESPGAIHLAADSPVGGIPMLGSPIESHGHPRASFMLVAQLDRAD